MINNSVMAALFTVFRHSLSAKERLCLLNCRVRSRDDRRCRHGVAGATQVWPLSCHRYGRLLLWDHSRWPYWTSSRRMLLP